KRSQVLSSAIDSNHGDDIKSSDCGRMDPRHTDACKFWSGGPGGLFLFRDAIVTIFFPKQYQKVFIQLISAVGLDELTGEIVQTYTNVCKSIPPVGIGLSRRRHGFKSRTGRPCLSITCTTRLNKPLFVGNVPVTWKIKNGDERLHVHGV